MSRSVNEAAGGAGAIASGIGVVADAARATSDGVVAAREASEELAGLAEELTRTVGRFRT